MSKFSTTIIIFVPPGSLKVGEGQQIFFARSAREILPPTFRSVAPPLPTSADCFRRTNSLGLQAKVTCFEFQPKVHFYISQRPNALLGFTPHLDYWQFQDR